MNAFSSLGKLRFSTQIIKQLFRPYQLHLENEIQEILKQNLKLQNYPEFKACELIHGGRKYSNVQLSSATHVKLHKSLVKPLDNIIEAQDELKEERSAITAYFRRLMNICDNPADVDSLLPDVVKEHIRIEDVFREAPWEVWNLSNSKDIIAMFNKENAEAINLLKERIMKNILSA